MSGDGVFYGMRPYLYTGHKDFEVAPFFFDENGKAHSIFKVNEKTGILSLKTGEKYHLAQVAYIKNQNFAIECLRVFEVKVLTPDRKLRKVAKKDSSNGFLR